MRNLGIIFFIIFFSVSGISQCKKFTKKNCVPQLENYTYNGQLNSAVLQEGDMAELLLTFYGGQDNRLLICSQEILGNVEFKVYDLEKNLLFDNTEHDFVKLWDFESTSTQQLAVLVKVPKGDSVEDMVQSGCVTILVGFKE